MTIKEIQQLIKDFETSNLTSMELEIDNIKLKLTKQDPHVQNYHAPVAQSQEFVVQPTVNPSHVILESSSHICVPVKSPLVGTYYASATPNGEPFVTVGQPVKKGETVCIVEAMKIMNEITCPVSGIVERIDVKNGQVVGYDQVLITIHTGESRGE